MSHNHIDNLKKLIKIICLALALPGLWLGVPAQEPYGQAIPDDVFYLMPSFGQGMVYFREQSPAQGQLNICAVDNTLRFIDDNGTELAASSHDGILKVQIDTVTFLRHQNAFLRLYPVSSATGIAVRREVRIIRGAKQSAYGGTSQTSSISEVGTLYTEGVAHELKSSRNAQYKVSETLFVYDGDSVILPSKKNLLKAFPAKRQVIEEYFKSHRNFPDNVDDARDLLVHWGW